MRVKIQFTKSPVGVYHLAHFAGDIVEMERNQADVFIEAGYAVEYSPALVQNNDLPSDIPGFKKLIAAGVGSLAELKEYTDLTEIPGIGKKIAEEIAAFLKK